jgi:hypothetical protein
MSPSNMPGTIRRPLREDRGRVKVRKVTPINITDVAAALSVITVTFDQPVSVKGVPQYAAVGAVGATPLSATQPSPNTVAITYTAPVATATAITVPFEDPAVRNATGGFVRSSSFAV